MRLYRHTPALTGAQTLVDVLVGRQEVLDTLSATLRAAARGGRYSHSLLIGPKGMGKSHILRLVYYAVRGDIQIPGFEGLSDRFVPVILAEEEYVSSLAKLLLIVVGHLAESEPPLSEVPVNLLKAPTLGERERTEAIAYVERLRAESGRILLLLADNLNDILEHMEEADQGEFRRLLMASDSVLVIGAAPTMFDAVTNHDCPLYNFFETVWLRDLDFTQAQELLVTYAQLDKRADMLDEIALRAPRIRAIHALTGGNPRLLLALYHIMAEDDIELVESTFLRMLDELSPYFRERMRDLTPQQREIVDVLAQSSEQLSPTVVAERARLGVNIVNAQLAKLEKLGYVRKYTRQGRKRVLYGMSEMLFSWWRQMRVDAGRRRLGWIVKLLAGWFTPEELEVRARGLENQLVRDSSQHSTTTARALAYYSEARAMVSEQGPNQRGRDEAAAVVTELPSGKESANAREWLASAILALQQGRPTDAARALETAQALAKTVDPSQDETFEPDLAESLNNLGVSYGELGRREEALEATERAFEIYERLVTRNPEAFKPKLAMSLSNLGLSYSEMGRREEALGAAERAFEIYEHLAARNPEAFEPNLAGSLSNLGLSYSEMGRLEEALAATERAVEIHERLVTRNPESLKTDLAMSLNNLGLRYREMGRREEALGATERAVEIYEHLAARNPEAFEPNLAGSLNNLGLSYREMGRREEALGATERAVEIYEHLAARNPEAFEPNLAGSLNNLGLTYSEMGRREEDLGATERAFEIYERLAKRNPDAFEPDLAMSLGNLGVSYSNMGRQEEALGATERAVEIYEHLAARNPDAFEPNLAGSLSNLGLRYSNMGRREEDLGATERAVEIHERLVTRNPEAFEPDLAMSLNNLGVSYSEMGRLEEALGATERAVEIYERLVTRNSEAFEPDLAMSLNNLSLSYGELGRREEALETSRRTLSLASHRDFLLSTALNAAVALYQRLLSVDASSAHAWLTELLAYCQTAANSVEVMGVLFRHLSSMPISAVIEAATTAQRDASDEVRQAIGPFVAATEYFTTGDPLHLDRLRPEERVFAEEVLEALKRRDNNTAGSGPS